MADALTDKMQDLIDRNEILQCITRCARGMDRHDIGLMSGAYHDDAIDDHGLFRGSREEFIEYVNGGPSGPGAHAALFDDHMHMLMNHTAEINGDTAHTETYYLMVGKYRGEARSGLWAGRYIDRLERRDGEWKIVVRRVIMGPSGELTDTASAGGDMLPHFVAGRWDTADISYDRPLVSPEREPA
jgi:hypothetical protein